MDNKDLVKVLKHCARRNCIDGCIKEPLPISGEECARRLMEESADTIERLEAENAALRDRCNKVLYILKDADECRGCRYAIDCTPCECADCEDDVACGEECKWFGDPCGRCDRNGGDEDLWEFGGEKDNTVLYTRLDQPENKPLTLDELREMDGEPIWTVTTGVEDSGRWELCACEMVRACPLHLVLRCVTAIGEATDYEFDTYGKTWIAYHHKPEQEGI